MKNNQNSIAEKLQVKKWNDMSASERLDLIRTYLYNEQKRMGKEGIEEVNADLSGFARMPLLILWGNERLMNGADGYCKGFNLIRINDKFQQNELIDEISNTNQFRDAVCIGLHELQHLFQKYLIKLSQRPFASESLKQYVKLFRINNCSDLKVRIPDFKNNDKMKNVNGTLNIKTISYGYATDAKQISNMFYVLSPAERDAWDACTSKVNRLIHILKDKCGYNDLMYRHNVVAEKISEFKNLYNCSHLSNNEVKSLVDRCFENIYFCTEPHNDLEALVMYDISCIAAVNRGSINKSVCCDFFDEYTKNRIFKENHYVAKNDIQIISKLNYKGYMLCPERFGNLSSESQIKNTALAICIASENLDAIKPYIKDLDAIKTYCMENVSKVMDADNAKDGITNLFGRKFYEILKYANEKHHGISMDRNIYNAMIDLIVAESDETERQSKPNTDNIEDINIQTNDKLNAEYRNSSYGKQDYEDDIEY